MFYERNIQPILGIVSIALGLWFGWRKNYWLTVPAAVVCGAASLGFAEFAHTATSGGLAATAAMHALRGFSVGTLVGAFIQAVRSS